MSTTISQQTADEVEIRNVIAQVAMITDGGDNLDEYADLFTDDAHWEMQGEPGKPNPFPPADGKANILAAAKQRRVVGGGGPGSHSYHTIPVTTIKLNGDNASARSYMVFFKNAHIQPEAALVRIYEDKFRRTPKGWKIASRTIVLP